MENTSPDCSITCRRHLGALGVVYDADDDRLLMATGNGDFDGNTGGHDWGDSVFASTPTARGPAQPIDTYTPTEFQTLQNTDADLGSTARDPPHPSIEPLPPPRVQSGKDAKLRLLNLDDLSGSGGPGHLGGELQKITCRRVAAS